MRFRFSSLLPFVRSPVRRDAPRPNCVFRAVARCGVSIRDEERSSDSRRGRKRKQFSRGFASGISSSRVASHALRARARRTCLGSCHPFPLTFRDCSSAESEAKIPAFLSTGRIAVHPYAVPEQRMTCKLARVNSALRRAGDMGACAATATSSSSLIVRVGV